MNYLLDTQAVIWSLDGDHRLSEEAKAAIEDTQNTLSITVISLWEIAIKRSIGKLKLTASLMDIQNLISTKEVSMLPLTVEHLETLETLAYQEKHRDPFDRLIISQAITENLTLISNDTHFRDYPVQILW